MVPSPRKRAAPQTRFENSWSETDAALFDPNALPVSRVPRGWERKQEVKKAGEGKEKKIWRRFNLRSRVENTAEEAEEEEQDARSRPVKRRQHMSPEAMEKTAGALNGKKRAFKATRWDRRKSVLPRKRATGTNVPAIDANEDDDEEAQEVTERDIESLTEQDTSVETPVEPVQTLPSVENDRRSTFTFTMDAPTVDDLPDYEDEDVDGMGGMEQDVEPTYTEDATLANFFRSPIKRTSVGHSRTPEKVQYPELPHSDGPEADTMTAIEPVAALEAIQQAGKSEVVEDAVVETAPIDDDMLEQSEQDIVPSIIAEELLVSPSAMELPAIATDIAYPTLPAEASPSPPASHHGEGLDQDVEMSEPTSDAFEEDKLHADEKIQEDSLESPETPDSDEEFTEASLQLDIIREYREALQEASSAPMGAQEQPLETEQHLEGEQDELNDVVAPSPTAVSEPAYDIADGLTLSFTPVKVPSADPTPRKLHSPPPPPRSESGPDDVTMTIAIDDDTAILKDFLNRAAASKADKAAIITHRRESLQNRRDSDVVRDALSSPRKALASKDPNSPNKYDNELTFDLSQTLTLSMPSEALAPSTDDAAETEGTEEEKAARGSRRSSRTKKSRLPAPTSSTQAQTPKIAIRRADGNEVVVLKKDDAKMLADETRTNTRKNKQGAFGVTVRLMKIAIDSASLPPIDDATKDLVVGKNVRWDEQLAYYQENPETMANALADAESLATPDELSMSDPASTPKVKNKTSKHSTPKIRRVRGLGSGNGTPGKGLLASASSSLPEAVQGEKDVAQAHAQAPSAQHASKLKPKAAKVKKMPVASTSIDSSLSLSSTDTKLPMLDVAPVGVVSSTQRKSRLAAPKKVVLPQVASSLPEGKENTQRPGLSDATPKKGIPAPKVAVLPTASTGMESGLPRRRGRKY
ncbi:hypothetical protein EJ02DRAFT_397812 [Clathrospora elynae]|uniref:Uncharacterized protein n=1 Tax=Clathrospora elynae TaxID=706981 RepID=A0A6A5SX57_9PLEO|nr:hypothetical protein EJ02DRAFT_397812 [Clathrospora elynae]